MKLRAILLSSGCLLLLALLGGGPVSRAGVNSWTEETSANVGSYANHLYGVAAADTTVAWAVGDYNISGGANYAPLIELWNGSSVSSSWAQVTPIPTPYQWVSSHLRATTATDTTKGWAVGDSTANGGSARPYAVHTNDGGSTWIMITPTPVDPGRPSVLYGVGGAADNDVWAVGYSQTQTATPTPEIQHWNGSAWSRSYSISGASTGVLYAVAASSGSNAWAVGYEPDGSNIHRVLVAHWDGSSWTQDTSAAFTISGSSIEESLQGVTILPNGDVIAVGYYDGGTNVGYQTVSFYYDYGNTTWSQKSTPNPHVGGDQFFGVAVGAYSNYVWAVGNEGTNAPAHTLTALWDGSSWSQVSSPSKANAGNFLKAVAVGPGGVCTGWDNWAAGYTAPNSGPAETLVLRYTVPANCTP